MITSKKPAEIPGIEDDVLLWASYKLVDNGIGHYECHGMSGYDERIEPEILEVYWDRGLYTEEQNKFIQDYINENDPYELFFNGYETGSQDEDGWPDEIDNIQPIRPC